MNLKEVIIAGQVISLRFLDRNELKGIYTDAQIRYAFYEAEFQGNKFLLLESKKNIRQTPLQYKATSDIIQAKKSLPCVFLFDSLAYYERNRLIERGVYFVVSNKFVFLPFLLMNAKARMDVDTEKLRPAAQYIVLCHLQNKTLNGYSLAKLESELPYKYVTLSRAVRQLEALSLIEASVDATGTKIINFKNDNALLWKTVEPLFQSPVKSRYYADEGVDGGIMSGVSALSHYSSLNPDEQVCFALDGETFKSLNNQNKLKGLNAQDGPIILEIWKYPPLMSSEIAGRRYVDRLSLYLSLRDDKDPRIEKELETMLKNMGLEN